MYDIGITGRVFGNYRINDIFKLAGGILLEFRIQLRQYCRTKIEFREVCYILQDVQDIESGAEGLVEFDCILQCMH